MAKKKAMKPHVRLTPTKYTEVSKLDYSVYIMTKQEKILYTLLAAIVLFAIGYVFYKNIIISCIFALLSFKYPDIRAKEIAEKRQRELGLQFKDMLYSLSSAVSSGSSVETGISIALDEMRKQYVSPDTMIIQELNLMVSRLSMGITIEQVMKDFANRSHNEDVRTFSNIFEVAKRQGGNMIQIIRQTTDVISQKIETKADIETELSGRKMEQKVLTAMPILLVVLMTYTTGGFMDVIFTSWEGRLVSTIALLMIIGGSLWSKKIADIHI